MSPRRSAGAMASDRTRPMSKNRKKTKTAAKAATAKRLSLARAGGEARFFDCDFDEECAGRVDFWGVEADVVLFLFDLRRRAFDRGRGQSEDGEFCADI